MKFSTLSYALISLTGIIATVLVYQEIASRSTSKKANVTTDNDNDERLRSMKTANLSHRLLEKGPKVIALKYDENGVPLDLDHAYASLRDLLDVYKRQHGRDKLRYEFYECEKGSKESCNELDNRKFLVSYYTCPDSAGNRFHNFMNGMIYAIATGRTLLHDVFDRESCTSFFTFTGVPVKRIQDYCEQFGSTEESRKQCDEVVERAEWMPSFRVWKQKLGLEEPTHAYCAMGAKAFDYGKEVVVDALPDRVISACGGIGQDAGRNLFKLLEKESTQFGKQSSLERTGILTRYDVINRIEGGGSGKFEAWQLYGTLFYNAFTIRPHLLPNPNQIILGPNVASIAIHSRHTNSRTDGSNTAEEEACLRRLLTTIKSKKTVDTCAVYIMSDRKVTIKHLTEFSQHLGCHAISMQHVSNQDTSVISEHGPFQKADFIKDLALVSNAEDGLIGDIRLSSSTMLLREMMEYNNRGKGVTGRVETCPLGRRH